MGNTSSLKISTVAAPTRTYLFDAGLQVNTKFLSHHLISIDVKPDDESKITCKRKITLRGQD